jgi:hypothetical protein
MTLKIIDQLSAADVAVLMNAIYFEGTWEAPFEKAETKEENFRGYTRDIKRVQMMHQEDDFSYLSNDIFEAVTLPYGNRTYSMTDLLVLDLVDKGLVTDQMVLTVGYDIENLTDPARRARYHGAVETDHYGRQIPKQAHGSINLDGHTSSTRKIMCAVSELFDRIVDKNLLVRRMYVVANHVLPEADAPKKNDGAVQLDLFTDYAAEEEKRKAEDAALERERKIQKAALAIKKKYGKNAILKAMNLEEGATAKDRNAQIGGHKA